MLKLFQNCNIRYQINHSSHSYLLLHELLLPQKLVVANWAEWIICSFIFVRGIFSFFSFCYLSTSRLICLNIFFPNTCAVTILEVNLAVDHLWAICCKKSSNICPKAIHCIYELALRVCFCEQNIKRASLEYSLWEQLKLCTISPFENYFIPRNNGRILLVIVTLEWKTRL